MAGLLPMPSTEERGKESHDVEAGSTDVSMQLSDRPTSTSDQNQIEAVPRKHRWTRVHSHFALMGGYTISPGLGPSQDRQMLTPAAMRRIAQNQPDLLPDLSEEDILDKNKASQFTKLLVCLQAIWFSVNMIGRLATGSPISPLELNTFLHALYCLAIYMAWWNKPLHIEKPVVVDASRGRMQEVRAWTYLREGPTCGWKHQDPSPDVEDHANSGFWYLEYMGIEQDPNSRLQDEDALKKSTHTEDGHERREYWYKDVQISPEADVARRNADTNLQSAFLKLYAGQTYYGFRLGHMTRGLKVPKSQKCPDIYAVLSPDKTESIRLLYSLKQGRDSENHWPLNSLDASNTMCKTGASLWKSLDDTLKEWRSSSGRRISKDLDTIFITCVLAAGSLYGGVHLLAWNGPFASLQERWMGQISCIIVAGPGILSPLLWIYKQIEDGWFGCSRAFTYWVINKFHMLETDRRIARTAGYTADFCLFCVLLILFLAYVAARVYIIVECFINLAHLPPEVYREPAWSRYIPHFGAG